MRGAMWFSILAVVIAVHLGCGSDPESSCEPGVHDSDGDGACDDVDNCVAVINPEQLDTDNDGFGDACDDEMGYLVCAGKGGDADDDNVCQAYDNCPEVANPDQRDQDGDGFGDVCDGTPLPCDDLGGDTDGDTVCDDVDNCPEDTNINQLDTDNDNIGDVCDPAVPTPGVCSGLGGDLDADDWCGVYDNCPAVSNPFQEDTDLDGVGDACDVETCDGADNDGDGDVDEGFPDTEEDGVADCVDPCPDEPFADADDDGLEDCVDPCPLDDSNDQDGDGICAPADNCPALAHTNLNDRDGDGIGDVCDVEECDGISNDADSAIDEGLPDADDDGTCDDIDICPDDPFDDQDGDGLCADADNCPAVDNPTQADDDADGWGNACDIDSADNCDSSAAVAPPGTVPIPPTLRMSAVVVHPTQDVLYGSVDSEGGAYANSILAVHIPTSSILWSTYVGSEPDALAISDDGLVLYVGLFGAASVRMVNVPLRRACLTFALPFDLFGGPLRAREMRVVPGSPETVVISTWRVGVSPSFGGVFVFDNGAPRPIHTPSHTGAREIVIADATTVYGYNNGTTEYGFRQLTITADGIAEDWVERDLFGGFYTDIQFADGRVYATSGAVVNPAIPSLAGTTTGSGQVAVDASLREAYYAESSTEISVHDIDTFTYKGSITISGAPAKPSALLVWGDDGLVALSDGILVVLDDVRGLP